MSKSAAPKSPNLEDRVYSDDEVQVLDEPAPAPAAEAKETKAAAPDERELLSKYKKLRTECLAELDQIAVDYEPDEDEVGEGALISYLKDTAGGLVDWHRERFVYKGITPAEEKHIKSLLRYLTGDGAKHAAAHRREVQDQYYADLEVDMLEEILELAEEEEEEEGAALRSNSDVLRQKVDAMIVELGYSTLRDQRREDALRLYLIDQVPKRWANRAAASKQKEEDRKKKKNEEDQAKAKSAAPVPPPRPASPQYAPSPAADEPPLLAAAHPGNTAPSGGVAAKAAESAAGPVAGAKAAPADPISALEAAAKAAPADLLDARAAEAVDKYLDALRRTKAQADVAVHTRAMVLMREGKGAAEATAMAAEQVQRAREEEEEKLQQRSVVAALSFSSSAAAVAAAAKKEKELPRPAEAVIDLEAELEAEEAAASLKRRVEEAAEVSAPKRLKSQSGDEAP